MGLRIVTLGSGCMHIQNATSSLVPTTCMFDSTVPTHVDENMRMVFSQSHVCLIAPSPWSDNTYLHVPNTYLTRTYTYLHAPNTYLTRTFQWRYASLSPWWWASSSPTSMHTTWAKRVYLTTGHPKFWKTFLKTPSFWSPRISRRIRCCMRRYWLRVSCVCVCVHVKQMARRSWPYIRPHIHTPQRTTKNQSEKVTHTHMYLNTFSKHLQNLFGRNVCTYAGTCLWWTSS